MASGSRTPALLRTTRRIASRRWRELAPALELALDERQHTPTRLVGTHRGRLVEVLVHRDGWADLRAKVDAPMPVGLHLEHQRQAKVLSKLGLKDVQVGTPEFDADVLVHSTHPAAVIRLLRDAGARTAVHRLLGGQAHARIVGDEVAVRLPPEVPEADARALLKEVVRTAEVLEEHARDIAREAALTRATVRANEPVALPERRFAPFDEQYLYRRRILRSMKLRRRIFGLALVPLLGGALFGVGTAVLVQLFGLPTDQVLWSLQQAAMWLTVTGAVAAIGGAAAYRCPACTTRILDGRGHMDLFARSCPGCGERLR